MPRFPKLQYQILSLKGAEVVGVTKSEFNSFDPSVLGLGNIGATSQPTDAIAAVFDLQGFTNFCKQIEPHLSVPSYLNSFLTWLMKQLREEMRRCDSGDNVVLFCPLPFFVKFLGDGLLVLWDCTSMNMTAQLNILVSVSEICDKYGREFLRSLRSKVVEPPTALRCGVARGTVFSIGDGKDFVGSCINMAARLQKLPGVSFVFNRRGFDIEARKDAFFTKTICIRQAAIRGIGDHELIGLLTLDLGSMAAADRKLYKPAK